MDASEAENAECQSAPSWSEQQAADHRLPDVVTLGIGTLGRIQYSVVHDREDDKVYLHVSHIEPHGTMKEKIMQGLGFTQDINMIAFSDIVQKIHDFTRNPTNGQETIEPIR
jgi:hypothetical protein